MRLDTLDTLQLPFGSRGECLHSLDLTNSFGQTLAQFGCQTDEPPLIITNTSHLDVQMRFGSEASTGGIRADIEFFGKFNSSDCFWS